jgi:hypothetical protein
MYPSHSLQLFPQNRLFSLPASAVLVVPVVLDLFDLFLFVFRGFLSQELNFLSA